MVATFSAALSNVVLNYICIKSFGYVAAAYTTLVSFILLAAFHYFVSRHLEKEKVFDIKFILLLTTVFLVLTLSVNFIYDLWWLRYILLAAILGIVLWKMKYFLSAFELMKVEQNS